jgi:hypothetical protein
LAALGNFAQLILGWLGSVDWLSVFAGLSSFVDQIGTWIRTVAIPTLVNYFGKLVGALSNWIGSIDWAGIASQLSLFIGAVGSWVTKVGLPAFLGWALDMGAQIIKGILDTLGGTEGKPGIVQQLVDWVVAVDWADLLLTIFHLAWDFGGSIIEGILDFLSGKADGKSIVDKLSDWFSKVDWGEVLQNIADMAIALGSKLIQTLQDVLVGTKTQKGLVQTVLDVFTGSDGLLAKLAGLLIQLGETGASMAAALGRAFANTLIGLIENGVNGAISIINRFVDAYNQIKVLLPGSPPFDVPHLGPVSIPRLDTGGIVPGALGSPQLILAHGGEEIRNSQQQMRAGEFSIGELHYHAAPGTDDITARREAEKLFDVLEDVAYRRGRTIQMRRHVMQS